MNCTTSSVESERFGLLPSPFSQLSQTPILGHKGCSFLEGMSQELKTYSKSRLLRNECD